MQSCPPFDALPYRQALRHDLCQQVAIALKEDLGSEDITARLIPEKASGGAQVISREPAILCGQPWVNEVFFQIDPAIKLHWLVNEGSPLAPNQAFLKLEGSLRSLLSGERTALNFLQMLSGTATTCFLYAQQVKHTAVRLLDTRKTIPCFRTAQKYAVTVGACYNHRIGLYDAFLIKENHIAACGSITAAVQAAKQQVPGKPVEVEVENFDELRQALSAQADIIMLDNFSLSDMAAAVKEIAGRCKLEASGNVESGNLVAIAETGVDYISIGALTKHVRAIDLSMRILT